MRIVVCDADDLLRSMVEVMISRQGHELVGVADAIGPAAGLLERARPDAAVIDLAMGVNADFDLVAIAQSVGAKVVVFSRTAYDELLNRYPERPVVVPKPDLEQLENALAHLGAPAEQPADRRRHPVREVSGPPPTGVGDAQAFYEALNGAVAGDALVWIDLTSLADERSAAAELGEQVVRVMRGHDRLLASPDAIRVFLPDAGDDGITAFGARLAAGPFVLVEAPMRGVVVEPGESPIEAFERLRRG
jgi:CheY-like chemotaxis protein